MNELELFTQNYFLTARTPFVTEILYVFSSFFDVTTFVSMSRFVIIIFCITTLVYLVRNIKYSILFLSTLFCGVVFTYFLKIFFDVARPLNGVIAVYGQSFPSYHATISTVFFIMLMYIFDDYLVGIKRILFNLFCVACIFIVAFSRVYLGVHWLSDVIGGIILGVLISYVSTKIFRSFQNR